MGPQPISPEYQSFTIESEPLENLIIWDCYVHLYNWLPSLPRPPTLTRKGFVPMIIIRSLAVGSLIHNIANDLGAALKA